MNGYLWKVKYVVKNEFPDKEPCIYGDGSLYVYAQDVFDALYKAKDKLKMFGFDNIEILQATYGG